MRGQLPIRPIVPLGKRETTLWDFLSRHYRDRLRRDDQARVVLLIDCWLKALALGEAAGHAAEAVRRRRFQEDAARESLAALDIAVELGLLPNGTAPALDKAGRSLALARFFGRA